MLECRGVVKELPQAKVGWEVKLAAGSQIPYIIDGENGQKRWCMEVFQAQTSSTARPVDEVPEPNLDNIVPSDEAPGGSKTSAPIAPMQEVARGILGNMIYDVREWSGSRMKHRICH